MTQTSKTQEITYQGIHYEIYHANQTGLSLSEFMTREKEVLKVQNRRLLNISDFARYANQYDRHEQIAQFLFRAAMQPNPKYTFKSGGFQYLPLLLDSVVSDFEFKSKSGLPYSYQTKNISPNEVEIRDLRAVFSLSNGGCANVRCTSPILGYVKGVKEDGFPMVYLDEETENWPSWQRTIEFELIAAGRHPILSAEGIPHLGNRSADRSAVIVIGTTGAETIVAHSVGLENAIEQEWTLVKVSDPFAP